MFQYAAQNGFTQANNTDANNASTTLTGAQQQLNQRSNFANAGTQFQHPAKDNTSSNAAPNAAQSNGASTSNESASTNANAPEQDNSAPNFIGSNGSVDWDGAVHWSIYKYDTDPHDRAYVKRPVIPLVEQVQKHLLPTALSIELHKLLKQVYTITNRSKQNATYKALTTDIVDSTMKMLKLSVSVEKRRGNTIPLYELDEVHESTRRLWFSLYELGFFGDSKGGRKYSAYQGISSYANINRTMDTIGRIIGSLKKSYSSHVDNRRSSVVNSKNFYR